MKGCAGKGISFVFGMLVGFMLFVMTIVLTGYALVTQVTLSRVEDLSGYKVPMISDDAKIRDMSILELGQYIMKGGITGLTLNEIYTVFGIDVIEIIENTLTDEQQGTSFLIEGPARDTLMQTPLMDLLNKTDILMDCIVLGDLAARLGQDFSSLPLIGNYMDYPVTEALSAITAQFDFSNGGMTLGDIQDLLGDGFDIGEVAIFQALKDIPLSQIGTAINSISIGEVLSIERDLYFNILDEDYIFIEEFAQIEFSKAYIPAPTDTQKTKYSFNEKYKQYVKDTAGTFIKAGDFAYEDCYDAYMLIASGETVAATDRYKKADGSYVQANDGLYKKETGVLLATNTYDFVQNKKGLYYVSDDTKVGDRYFAPELPSPTLTPEELSALEAKNKKGQYKLVKEYIRATSATAEQLVAFPTLYRPAYTAVIETVDGGSPKLVQQGYIRKNALALTAEDNASFAGYIEYRLNSNTWEYNYGSNTVADWQAAQRYSIQTSAGENPTNSLVKAEDGNYALVYRGKDPAILKALAECALQGENGFSNKVNTLKVGDVMPAHSDYWVPNLAKGDTKDTIQFVKESDGSFRAATSAEAADANILKYNAPSSKIVVRLSDVVVTKLGDEIDDIAIGDIIDIDADTFVEIPSSGNTLVRENGDDTSKILAVNITTVVGGVNTIETKTDLEENLFYKSESGIMYHYNFDNAEHYTKGTYFYRTKVGATHVTIQKLASCTIRDLGGSTMSDVISSLVIGDLMKVYDEEGYYTDDNGTHVNTGTAEAPIWTAYDAALHAGKQRYSWQNQSSKLLIRLKNVAVDQLGNEIDNIKIGDIITINENNIYEETSEPATDDKTVFGVVAILDETVFSNQATNPYLGSYEYTTYIDVDDNDADGNTDEVRVKILARYKANHTYLAGQPFYKIAENGRKSNGALIKMADLSIGTLGTQMQNTIDGMTMQEIISIDGDIYEKLSQTTYAEAQAAVGTEHVYIYDAVSKLFAITQDSGAVAPFYKMIYKGGDHIVFKKLANTGLSDIGSAMTAIVETTTLGELIEVKVENDFEAYTTGSATRYSILTTVKAINKDTIVQAYFGTYELWTLTAGDALIGAEEVGDVRLMVIDNAGGYVIKENGKRSNGALVAMTDKTIGNMSSGMQSAIDDTVLKEVLTINGDVFLKLNASTYAEALVAIMAEASISDKTVFVYKDYIFSDYDAVQDVAATEFFARLHTGNSSAVIKRLATVPVAKMGSSMQTAIDDTRLGDLLTINGDTFEKLNAVDYPSAMTEAGGSYADALFVLDDGMYRPVEEYIKATESQITDSAYTKYIKNGSTFEVYVDQAGTKYIKSQDWIANSDKVNGYYKRTVKGTDNAVLKRLEGIKLSQLGSKTDTAIKDTTLAELGIGGTGILGMPTIQNAKIDELPDAISNVMANATLRQLNEWGGLGLSSTAITALNVYNYRQKVPSTDPSYNPAYAGSDEQYDMTARDFFSNLVISVDPITGNITITLS